MARFQKLAGGDYLDSASADNDIITAAQLEKLLNSHKAAKAIASSVKDNEGLGKSNKEKTQEFIDDLESSKLQQV